MILEKMLLQGIDGIAAYVEKLAALLTLAVIVAPVVSMHVLAYIDKAGRARCVNDILFDNTLVNHSLELTIDSRGSNALAMCAEVIADFGNRGVFTCDCLQIALKLLALICVIWSFRFHMQISLI